MRLALEEAKKAQIENEVPVGAVIVLNDQVIAKAHNKRESSKNAIAHAEILAIDEACKVLGDWRLDECVLFVTLEPCAMCGGAAYLSRLKGIVYGATDHKGGSLGGSFDLSLVKGFNHQPFIKSSILEDECSEIIAEFFKTKRI